MIFALDSDTFALAHQNTLGVRERIAKVAAPDAVALTFITRVESLKGRLDYVLKAADGADVLRAVAWLARTEAFLAGFPVLPFDATAGTIYDRLRTDKRTRGMGRGDLLVASVALAHGATLVTRNTRDFAPVPGLALADWTA